MFLGKVLSSVGWELIKTACKIPEKWHSQSSERLKRHLQDIFNNTDVFWSKGQRLKIEPYRDVCVCASLLFHSSWELHSQLCVIYFFCFIWKCIRFQKQNGWWNREHVMLILWSNTHWTQSFNDSYHIHHCGRLSDHEGLLRFQTCCL